MTSELMADATDPGSSAERPLLSVSGLRMYFPVTEGMIIERHVGDVRAVDDVSFDVRRGETLGLVGESGCGKSTTGRTVLRLYKPTAGTVVFDGLDITKIEGEALRQMRRHMQMIFQDPYSSLNPRQTVGGIVGEPLLVHKIGSSAERQERIAELLDVVGLNPNFLNRYPHEFSGGQRQRVGVARALAVNPDLIVADEPISALDVSIQAQIINLLVRLQDRFGLTYLFIAHDLSVVRHVSDRIAVMYLGRIVEIARSRDLYERPLHPYSVALLSAVPIPDPAVESRRRRIILTRRRPEPGRAAAGLPLPHPLLAPGAARQPGVVRDRGSRPADARDRSRGRLPLRRGGRQFGRAGPGDRSTGRQPGGGGRFRRRCRDGGRLDDRRGRRRLTPDPPAGGGWRARLGSCRRSASPSPRSRRGSASSMPTSPATTSSSRRPAAAAPTSSSSPSSV